MREWVNTSVTSPRQPISPQDFFQTVMCRTSQKESKQAESRGQTTNFITIVQSLQRLLQYTIISYANSFKELFNAIGQHWVLPFTHRILAGQHILHGIQEFFVREFSGYKEIDLLEFEPKW